MVGDDFTSKQGDPNTDLAAYMEERRRKHKQYLKTASMARRKISQLQDLDSKMRAIKQMKSDDGQS